MTFPDQGYVLVVIPDDTAGPPLTPVEKAAIADLERRFLLSAAAPGRDHALFARPTRFGRVRRRATTGVVPLVALFVTAVLLVVVAVVTGGGPLGVAAVVISTVGTAALWPLLPARFGGPVRARRRPVRIHRAVHRRPGPA